MQCFCLISVALDMYYMRHNSLCRQRKHCVMICSISQAALWHADLGQQFDAAVMMGLQTLQPCQLVQIRRLFSHVSGRVTKPEQTTTARVLSQNWNTTSSGKPQPHIICIHCLLTVLNVNKCHIPPFVYN